MHVQLSTGLKHQHTQNSRQLWGGWVGPTLYAISIQKKLLTIMDGPLTMVRFLFDSFGKSQNLGPGKPEILGGVLLTPKEAAGNF